MIIHLIHTSNLDQGKLRKSRYSDDPKLGPSISSIELADSVLDEVRRSARLFELDVAGVDLKIDRGVATWLEVNPNPGYTWFQDATGQPIAESIASYLVTGY